MCTGEFAGLFRRLDAAYTSYLQDHMKSAESHYKAANNTNSQFFVASPVVKLETTQSSVARSSVASAKSVTKHQAVNNDGGAFVKSILVLVVLL